MGVLGDVESQLLSCWWKLKLNEQNIVCKLGNMALTQQHCHRECNFDMTYGKLGLIKLTTQTLEIEMEGWQLNGVVTPNLLRFAAIAVRLRFLLFFDNESSSWGAQQQWDILNIHPCKLTCNPQIMYKKDQKGPSSSRRYFFAPFNSRAMSPPSKLVGWNKVSQF